MRNDLVFFKHDLNMESDLAVSSLIRRYGYEGLGLFIHVLHIIYPTGGETSAQSLCDELDDCSDNGAEIFSYMIRKGLLKQDGDRVWSDRAKQEIAFAEAKSKVRSEAGRNGAEAKWRNARDGKSQQMPSSDMAKDSTREYKTIQEKTKESVLRFTRPTVEQIEEYCRGRGNNIDANAFHDHYESNGWKVGTASMKDWKACVRTWEKNDIGAGRKTAPRKDAGMTTSPTVMAESRQTDGGFAL